MSEEDREEILTITKSLRDSHPDGECPTDAQIMLELLRRLNECKDMFAEERMARVKAEGDAMEYRHRLVACGAW